jgi:diaminohydroxyphosphoribosylaminopyrimidine deaminase/5-amino-6-(5-phosphoribosylamino)uracil reductase
MLLALRLARRGYGSTSPNPMVGAVLVKDGQLIARGWHRQAGAPHAEIEAIRDAERQGFSARGTTLYVTLEPCCTHGRTPPCTDAILTAGIRRAVIGATDPNPRHAGRGVRILRKAGIEVTHGVLADECAQLNEAFNHWIVHTTPFVTVKAAMTLDGKIATASGESQWITSGPARTRAMRLRQGSDAILVGINTVLADDPSLTLRGPAANQRVRQGRPLRRIVLDAMARTPIDAQVINDRFAPWTTIVVGPRAPAIRRRKLAQTVQVWTAPVGRHGFNLRWLLQRLGREQIVNLLVEGGGETAASFLEQGLVQRVAFFYAPKLLGGARARRAVAGRGAQRQAELIPLAQAKWRRCGQDLLLTARLPEPGQR